MSPILFVHGAWMDKRCWEPILERMEGRRIDSFDLPGHGQDTTPLSEISLDAYVSRVVEHAESLGGDVVLVGHSMAGIVLCQSAETRPDLFEKLIYVAAYLPTNGQSLNDLAQADGASKAGPHLRPAADWSTLDIEESARGDLFFHDVDPAVAAPYLSTWKAEPVRPPSTPLALTDERFGSVERAYVRTAQDRIVSPQLQSLMLEKTPTSSIELNCGHAVMLAQPDALAQALEDLS